VSAILGERGINPTDINEPNKARREYENLFDISKDELCKSNNTEMENMKKEPRRRTIYVPSEDTTIMTIHPGASLKAGDRGHLLARHANLDLVTVSEDDEQVADRHKRKAARKSLATAPRRAPLSHVSKAVQGQSSSLEITGTGGGKENIPPNGKEVGKKGSKIVITIDDQKSGAVKARSQNEAHKAPPKGSGLGRNRDQKQVQQKALNPRSILINNPQSPSSSRKRTSSESADSSGRSKFLKQKRNASSSVDKQPLGTAKRQNSGLLRLSPPDRRPTNTPPSLSRHAHQPERLPSKLSVPVVLQLAQEHQDRYPVLLENISRPEMYEDNWLNHQEEAITQLLNGLFDSVDGGRQQQQQQQMGTLEKQDLRKALLGLYHQPSFPLIYKRLQASLLYGALSVPKELLSKTIRLKDDVGFKRKFLSLWVETYQPSALKAASEVVTGREIARVPRCSGESSLENDERRVRTERRSIETFLDIFLIRNEDAVRPKNTVASIGNIARGNTGGSSAEGNTIDFGSQGWAWRRTILRSLMLILLLDTGKANGSIRDCLFLKSSQHKSTTSVLQTLSNLLLPSLGDITRPLGHLNYHTAHIQYPLEEYDYKITNLATDMRDGVRLTRLVELLLYPPSSLLRERDITVTMPTGDILTTASNHTDSWVLSHHLKFPCAGRSQKVYNVQVALAALQGVSGGTANHGGVKAEEIVDGHREKTVGLLWGLVSKWGLGTLVDWKELRKEVRRLQVRLHEKRMKEEGKTGIADQDESGDDDDYDDEGGVEYMQGLERYTHLLQAWASAIAKLHGKRMTNLTTSFADGVIFEKIVGEYEVYFPPAALLQQQMELTVEGRHARGLEWKLRRLGCSNYFCEFASPNSYDGSTIDGR
jgi:abnormal spindle-like microcephaly-associated protein